MMVDSPSSLSVPGTGLFYFTPNTLLSQPESPALLFPASPCCHEQLTSRPRYLAQGFLLSPASVHTNDLIHISISLSVKPSSFPPSLLPLPPSYHVQPRYHSGGITSAGSVCCFGYLEESFFSPQLPSNFVHSPEFQGYKPDTKGQMLHDSTYMSYLK